MQDWILQVNELEAHGLSIRVQKDDQTVFESDAPMLRPLYICLQQHRDLMCGATVIDKIVGKAAAYLCVIGKVAQVLTPLASQSAQDVLQQHGIRLHAVRVIPQIMNRNNSGPCPMEQMANSYTSAQDFYAALVAKMQDSVRAAP